MKTLITTAIFSFLFSLNALAGFKGSLVCHRGGNGKFTLDFDKKVIDFQNVLTKDQWDQAVRGLLNIPYISRRAASASFSVSEAESAFYTATQVSAENLTVSGGPEEAYVVASANLSLWNYGSLEEESLFVGFNGEIEIVVKTLSRYDIDPLSNVRVPVFEESIRFFEPVFCEISR